MRQRALLAVLLVHAIEQTDVVGDALSMDDRAHATREALESRPLPATSAPAQMDGNSKRFLARRAEALLARLRIRSPGVDSVLAAAGRSPGLDRATLLLGFVIGVAIAFADGRRIDIFAYPLVGLVIWNLIVYLVLIIRASRPRRRAPARGSSQSDERADMESAPGFRAAGTTQRNAPAGGPAAMDGRWRGPTAAVQHDGFFRRWLARAYAKGVRARINALITHSIGFNAPLAPGLRRFAADWWEAGRPLFRERARRLLHLSAILAAVGLMVGYDFRGWFPYLHQPAGWGATVFGPTSAHAALVTLYGAASGIGGVPIPSAHNLQALAWTSPTTGGGPAGQWLKLIDLTALLYIVLPRLLAVIITTLSLWRRSATLRTPPSFAGYLAAVLRSRTPEPAPPKAGSSS